MNPLEMQDYSYRAIYLGNNKWAVRRFGYGCCDEIRFNLKVEDPQLRSSDKLAIEEAKKLNTWRAI